MRKEHELEAQAVVALAAESATAVAEPDVAEPSEQVVKKRKKDRRTKPKRQPPYHVILWDDNAHTYHYVMMMMLEVFGHPLEKGYEIAKQVDSQGRAIVLTTTREHAELKRDQIHAYGKDDLIADCTGAMWCTIEPSE